MQLVDLLTVSDSSYLANMEKIIVKVWGNGEAKQLTENLSIEVPGLKDS